MCDNVQFFTVTFNQFNAYFIFSQKSHKNCHLKLYLEDNIQEILTNIIGQLEKISIKVHASLHLV